VFDPFAGSGTVGAAAASLNRRFVLFEINEKYVKMICQDAQQWLGKDFDHVLLINCDQACKRQQFCFL
jgi:DNA modification methylase